MRARGPIKFTCPDIDKNKKTLSDTASDLNYIIKNFGRHSMDDIQKAIESAINEINEVADFMEEIRGSNDELRNWGSEQEDRVNELQEEIEDLNRQIERWKDDNEDLKSAIKDLERELSCRTS